MKDNATPLIVSFCNWNYSRVALNWVAYLRKLEIERYLIISLDEKTEEFLLKNGINTKLIRGEILKKSGTGWRWRFQQTYNFLKSGTNIIHSDLDAIWLKNPLNFLDNESDIIASGDGGMHPTETYDKWGFTICMGWVYYRSNDCVLDIFENILNAEYPDPRINDFDDQVEFNHYLSSKIKGEDISITDSGDRQMQLQNLKIRVLSSDVVTRDDYDENAYVCHPLMKKQSNCELQLQKRGLWSL